MNKTTEASHNLKQLNYAQEIRTNKGADDIVKWTPEITYLWLEAENGERVRIKEARVNCSDDNTVTITFKRDEAAEPAGRVI